MTDDKVIDGMCPKCREAAHGWISDVCRGVERINAANRRLQVSAFLLGAATTISILLGVAWWLSK